MPPRVMFLLAATCLLIAWPAAAEELRVDCAVELGVVRPLHGVNGGPLVEGETVDLSGHWRELAIPLTRLHDCEWPSGTVVDLHAVFPDLNADPQSPQSYDFARTDDYLAAVVQTGAGIVYRLGESIEHSRRKHHVHPPADYEQWSAACLGVIRHYNEGWADGFQYQIRYWEIWNEPENRPAMWTGSDEDYYRLYAAAAKAIKAEFPQLKVGGPSVGATGEVVEGRLQATPFLEGFLRHCRINGVPLDFFSWHTYADDPDVYTQKAQAIRRWLDEHGFHDTEIHLNEWNYLPDNDWSPLLATGLGLKRQQWHEAMSGPAGAAFAACVLIELQDSPVDIANFYRGDLGHFGLFNHHGVPNKVFYAMQGFRRLLDTPQRVQATGGQTGQLALCAGLNQAGTELTVLISNYRSQDDRHELRIEHLPWQGATSCEFYRIDQQHDLELVQTQRIDAASAGLSCSLPAPGVTVLKLRPAGQ